MKHVSKVALQRFVFAVVVIAALVLSGVNGGGAALEKVAQAAGLSAPKTQSTFSCFAYLPLVATAPPAATPGPLHYTYRIVNTYPHDTSAFTEGLLYDGGSLYESTGLIGQSGVRQEVLATGQVVQSLSLARQYFGEGITTFGNRLMELTWQSNLGFIYDKNTFAPLGQFNYPTEGWGLTNDGQRLIMSDGTAVLYFLDPQTFLETGRISVTDGGQPVKELNELEYVQGQIYANVWLTNRIAVISPQTGQVTAWIDLTGLRPAQTLSNPDAVLNGIAYDAAQNRLFVTGKLWPSLYEIQLIPQ